MKYRPDYLYTSQKSINPNAHKLYDFRIEPGFSDTAREIVAQGRTLLGYERLFTLWQAVGGIYPLNEAVAEVGTYKGGSARFIAAALNYRKCTPPIHVFDTFQGHPSIVIPELDGPHSAQGLFADTDVAAVRQYLSVFSNVEIHQGAFRDTNAEVRDATFSLVHIDVDIYQSGVECLDFFWPRLHPEGVLVIDDYGFTTCRGLKKAVDEFIAANFCRHWYIHTGQFVMCK